MTISTQKLSDEEKRERKREQGRRYYQANKAKICARTSAYHFANREQRLVQQKEYALRTKYGLTAEQRDEMLAAQGMVCAVCLDSDPGTKGWVVDPCHASGDVRGVLCNNCNLLLGHARDNPQTLSNAIKYLGH